MVKQGRCRKHRGLKPMLLWRPFYLYILSREVYGNEYVTFGGIYGGQADGYF